MPQLRRVVRAHRDLPLPVVSALLGDRAHEHRMVAVLLLADQYTRADRAGDRSRCERLADAYLANAAGVNNWDLVDARAEVKVRGRGARMRTDLPRSVRAVPVPAAAGRPRVASPRHPVRKNMQNLPSSPQNSRGRRFCMFGGYTGAATASPPGPVSGTAADRGPICGRALQS
jgi:hypothetical protein